MTAASLSDGEHTLSEGPLPLDRALRQLYDNASLNVVRRAIDTGKVSVDDMVVRDSRQKVQKGSRITVRMAAAKHPKVELADDVIVHLDNYVVVVNKPPGIVSVPDANWRRGTLSQLIGDRIRRKRDRAVPLGVVQRLDMETSGLIVFPRTKEAYGALKEQFKRRDVGRNYMALVAGVASDTTIRSYLTEHKNGKRSSTRHKHLGKFACTHVEVLERLTGATLVRCVLETGRTHQIRIHLAEAGHPLLGDRRYARRAVETPPAPRVMLHAGTLEFVHPITEAPMHFEERLPPDMSAVLKGLRPRKGKKRDD